MEKGCSEECDREMENRWRKKLERISRERDRVRKVKYKKKKNTEKGRMISMGFRE